MKIFGYILIAISIPACSMIFVFDWLSSGTNSRLSFMALPIFFTIACFLGGLACIRISGIPEEARRKKEAQTAQQKAKERQQEEDEIIKKWVDKQPE